MSIQSLPPAPPQTPLPYQPVSTPPGNNRTRILWISLAVIVSLIAATVVVIAALGNNGPKPATPTGLHVVSKTATSVTIGWSRPSGPEPTLYRIYRDNSRVSSETGDQLRFQDTGLTPLTAYRYQVAAYNDGAESDRSAAINVRTPAATLASARLVGDYSVRLKINSESGYTSIEPGDVINTNWSFHRNASGATILNGESWSGGDWRMRMTRNGLVYTGHTNAGISQCSYTTVNTSIDVSLRVVKAGVIDEVWTVTRFTGQLSQNAGAASAGLYTCPGASFTATLAGRG